jgi:hypothetical protein
MQAAISAAKTCKCLEKEALCAVRNVKKGLP